mgnify:CR=1 FL=1
MLKLKMFDKTKHVLIDGLKFIKGMEKNIEVQSKNVSFLLLLAKTYLEEDMLYPDWKFKDNPDAKQAIIQARAIQQEVIEMCVSRLQHNEIKI